jgi:mono/diheme cytochrome c family protein
LDEEGKLQEFTAACAPFYYRGTALPEAYYGNVFVCEPSGNLIKRNVVSEGGIMLLAEDPNPGREFLASTDERFRPVNLASGPDGALYIADMYRGLVQHGAYISPYLREQTLSRKLLLPVNLGRIWRIVPEGLPPEPIPKLAPFTLKELVLTLFHPNGWHRDMAQRLLVERNDPKSIPLLWETIQEKSNRWGKIQAIWTLEGLQGLEANALVNLLSDPDPYVAATALRLLEPFAHTNPKLGKTIFSYINPSFLHELTPCVLQLALSASVLFPEASSEMSGKILTRHSDSPLIRDAVLSGLEKNQFDVLQNLMQHSDWKTSDPDKEIVIEMLTGSIVTKGNPKEVGQLLTFLEKNTPTQNWKYTPILTAMTILGSNSPLQPIPLQQAPTLLTGNGNESLTPNQYAALLNLFSWPGHQKIQERTDQSVSLTGEEQKLFALGRQHYLSTCSGCHGNTGEGVNRMGPPLAGSEWVTGDQKQLSLIVLHGMEGPVEVKGRVYDAPDILPVMPAHTSLDDRTLAAILTYIRNEWGNNAGAVESRFIATTRNVTQGRVVPWSADELKTYIEAENAQSQ